MKISKYELEILKRLQRVENEETARKLVKKIKRFQNKKLKNSRNVNPIGSQDGLYFFKGWK